MSAPRLSVVITCHNQANFIAAAVDSVVRQVQPGHEVIVVDDASTDGSTEILKNYANSVRLILCPENRGALEARNQGAAAATGKHVAFLDGDDLLTPWALEVYDRIISDRAPKFIIGCAHWFHNPVVPLLQLRDMPRTIEFMDRPVLMAKDRAVWVSASVFVVDRLTFESVGGWTPGIFHGDVWDLATKIGQAGRTVCIYSPPTALYRIHDANSIHNVKPFVQMTHRIIDREKTGQYTRTPNSQLQRNAWFGGMAAFWVKRAARAGLYKEAAGLVVSGGVMILSAIVCRTWALIRGRQPLSRLDWPHA